MELRHQRRQPFYCNSQRHFWRRPVNLPPPGLLDKDLPGVRSPISSPFCFYEDAKADLEQKCQQPTGKQIPSFSFRATPLKPFRVTDGSVSGHGATYSSWVVRSELGDLTRGPQRAVPSARQLSTLIQPEEANQKPSNRYVFARTHQTSSDVLDGLPGVHTRPVVQHVADTGRTVDEPNVVFASLGQRVKTGYKKKSRGKKKKKA